MGDRCVFGFRETSECKEETIWLYSHWGGSSRLEALASAIVKAQPRWNDSSYATRIAISQIVGNDWNSEYGFGLFAGKDYKGDNEYGDLLVVNWDERTVIGESENGTELVEYGFETFINMHHAMLNPTSGYVSPFISIEELS